MEQREIGWISDNSMIIQFSEAQTSDLTFMMVKSDFWHEINSLDRETLMTWSYQEGCETNYSGKQNYQEKETVSAFKSCQGCFPCKIRTSGKTFKVVRWWKTRDCWNRSFHVSTTLNIQIKFCFMLPLGSFNLETFNFYVKTFPVSTQI